MSRKRKISLTNLQIQNINVLAMIRKKRLMEEAQAKYNQAKSKGDSSSMETIKKSLNELEKDVKQIDQKVDGIIKEERVINSTAIFMASISSLFSIKSSANCSFFIMSIYWVSSSMPLYCRNWFTRRGFGGISPVKNFMVLSALH